MATTDKKALASLEGKQGEDKPKVAKTGRYVFVKRRHMKPLLYRPDPYDPSTWRNLAGEDIAYNVKADRGNPPITYNVKAATQEDLKAYYDSTKGLTNKVKFIEK